MRTYVVTEGRLEASLMARLMKCHPVLSGRDIDVSSTWGRSSAFSKSRTLLSLRRGTVAVIISPETVSPNLIAQQRAFVEWHIGEAGMPEDWQVVLVPPDVAVLLFHDEVMGAVLPGPLSIEERIRGRYEPRVVLKELFGESEDGSVPGALLQRLAQADLSPLWRLEVLKPLEAFLLRVSRVQDAGTSTPQDAPGAP